MANNKQNGTNSAELTYEQNRLNYFRAQLKKAEAKCVRLKRLCGSKEVGSYIAEDARVLNNTLQECAYYRDIIQILEQMPPKDSSCDDIKGVYAPDMQMPNTCGDCAFRAPYEYIPADKGLYKKISFCIFAPQGVKDPFRTEVWMSQNKEKWCPLIRGCSIGKT